MGYKVKTFDLSTPFESEWLVEPGSRVASIIVTKFDSGTVLQLAIGNNPLFYVPSVMGIDLADEDDQSMSYGVRVCNPVAQAGVVVQFVVTSGRGGIHGRNG